MPKRTAISSILVIDTGPSPSHPLGGEGRGEGVYGAVGGTLRWCAAAPLSLPPAGAGSLPLPLKGARAFAAAPRSRLRYARHSLPLKGVREGSAGIAVQGDQDRAGDAFEVGQDFVVGEADDAIASGFQRDSARGVVSGGVGVAVAIDLDHQPFGSRGEVGDVGFEHDLALELDADATAAKDGPQLGLYRRHFAAQAFGAGSGFDVALQPRSPSPNPLPLKGERAFMAAV